MKTTLDIHDELLARARRRARETGCPLRALVEEGLRQVLARPVPRSRYKLPDLRAGDPAAPDPLERYSRSELRDAIYGSTGAEAGKKFADTYRDFTAEVDLSESGLDPDELFGNFRGKGRGDDDLS
ncbi:MAG: type II toxin-antitoxin system VapB family antitoxin [Rhodospirillaceae bacterium]|nr:type II toxin-antitoxin system VapB family antitoxin [Rhodospirillaceae bacterium]